MPELNDYSYGAIPLWREPDDSEPLLLVLQHHAGHWGFPKGHPETGETPLETAQRELAEETGLDEVAWVEEPRFNQSYDFTWGEDIYHKTVTYFPAYVREASVTPEPAEIRDYAWVSLDRAQSLLVVKGNPNDALDQFVAWWRRGA